MPDKRCENGHFIDEQWDICPYCPSEPSRSVAAVSAPAPSQQEGSERRSLPRETRSRAVESGGRSGASPEPPIHRTIVAPKLPPVTPTERFVVGWLVAVNGVLRGESYPIRMGRNIIGRSSHCDIVVTDEQASSHHADIVYRPDERRFILMDHNSTNGTFVNGAEIPARKDLDNRDVIRVGKQKFIFQALCDATFGWDDQEHGK